MICRNPALALAFATLPAGSHTLTVCIEDAPARQLTELRYARMISARILHGVDHHVNHHAETGIMKTHEPGTTNS